LSEAVDGIRGWSGSAGRWRARRGPTAGHRNEHSGGDHTGGKETAINPPAAPGTPPGLPDHGIVDVAGQRIGHVERGWSGQAHDVSFLPRHSAILNSTMLHVKVDKADPNDLYEQVAAEIRRAIADGEAQPGERLPPAKDLAAVLDVNTNTVLRALRLLRDEGLLEFKRGRGISVVGTPERGAVIQRTRELVQYARQHGYRPDDLVQIIQDLG